MLTKKRWGKVLVPGLLALLTIYWLVLELRHRNKYGHYFTYGIHVDAMNRDAYIGIPGQTKMYWARVFNFTLIPRQFAACDYVTDAMGTGTELPYAVERFDPSTQTWQTVVEFQREGFCKPQPLSTIETHLGSYWLWPGIGMDAMEGEATGARAPFQKGDLARFVIYKDIADRNQDRSAIPSEPFLIEDQVERDEGIPLRVKH